ncbi:MAG: bifunctional acetate--CoA ligase family protein/GNAT family N-acetyltransferase [Candidatus Bathyarchaeota archaeon]
MQRNRSGLDIIFNPTNIVLIGASDRVGSVGYTLLKNLTERGYEGNIYPVNIRKTEILGLKAYSSLEQLPKQIDLAIIATPARTVPAILEQCGEFGIKGVVIISAGFKEIGAEGKDLEKKILEIKKTYNMCIIGPNCLGIIRPTINLNATFTTIMPQSGEIAFVSQSGAVGGAILDWAIQKNIGFSIFVSIGSMIDVDFGDLIDYFGTDPSTKSILLYIEGMTEVKKFMSAARHFAKTKPIIVVKAGKFSESAKAVSSHTGSLTGEDLVYDAAFKRAGIVRVDEVADLFSSAEVLSMQPLPKGPNLAIITNAGGLGVMATDALIARKGKIAKLGKETLKALDEVLPHYWSRGNPIDILGDARADRYNSVINACLKDENIDGLLIINIAVGDPMEVAQTVVEISKLARDKGKTILTSFSGSARTREKEAEVTQILTENKVPTFTTPEQAVKAYMYMYQYKRNLELLYETPEELPAGSASPKYPLFTLIKEITSENRELLTEEEAKIILEYCGIPTIQTLVARTIEDTSEIASKIGYPVALKILSPQITHKTNAGGVKLNINNESELQNAFNQIMIGAKNYDPTASILGVTVQPMIKKDGYEIIIGAKRDPLFGPVIMFGMGGILVELFKDISIGLPPLNKTLAKRIMEETKVLSLLKGYRNLPAANIELLEETLVKFSQMLVDFPQIKEVDINPLFIDEKEAFALDARIIIDKADISEKTRPYQHLVVSPYPTRYEDFYKLHNGQRVLLRPIKPEDEPMWMEMINSFKNQKLYRFVQKIQEMPPETRAQYCNIDYDRELAIVAELSENEQRKIAGVVRLIKSYDNQSGEITFVVATPWQRLGLGRKLVELIIRICQNMNLKQIFSIILQENISAIDLLKKLGFTFEYLEDKTAVATLNLN